MSRDPKGLWGDEAQRGNAQSYCGGDPVNRVDPTGLTTLFPNSPEGRILEQQYDALTAAGISLSNDIRQLHEDWKKLDRCDPYAFDGKNLLYKNRLRALQEALDGLSRSIRELELRAADMSKSQPRSGPRTTVIGPTAGDVADVGSKVLPGISNLRSALEAITGRDARTGAPITTAARGWAAAGVICGGGLSFFGKFKAARNATRLGFKRNNPGDWRRWRDSWDKAGYGGALSKANRKRIAQGKTPVVDDDWVKMFPGDAALRGQKITMHHIGGTPIHIPLPKDRHMDAHSPGGTRYNPGGPGSSG